MNLLLEIRYVSREVGGRGQAMKMPVYERRWWIDQMQKEAQQGAGQGGGDPDGKTVLRG